jgi:hypothetical protein
MSAIFRTCHVLRKANSRVSDMVRKLSSKQVRFLGFSWVSEV